MSSAPVDSHETMMALPSSTAPRTLITGLHETLAHTCCSRAAGGEATRAREWRLYASDQPKCMTCSDYGSKRTKLIAAKPCLSNQNSQFVVHEHRILLWTTVLPPYPLQKPCRHGYALGQPANASLCVNSEFARGLGAQLAGPCRWCNSSVPRRACQSKPAPGSNLRPGAMCS